MHMKKYGVIKVMGDEIRVLEVCETREAAQRATRLQKEKYSGQNVAINAVYGDFDENGRFDRSRFLLLYEP